MKKNKNNNFVGKYQGKTPKMSRIFYIIIIDCNYNFLFYVSLLGPRIENAAPYSFHLVRLSVCLSVRLSVRLSTISVKTKTQKLYGVEIWNFTWWFSTIWRFAYPIFMQIHQIFFEKLRFFTNGALPDFVGFLVYL